MDSDRMSGSGGSLWKACLSGFLTVLSESSQGPIMGRETEEPVGKSSELAHRGPTPCSFCAEVHLPRHALTSFTAFMTYRRVCMKEGL